MSVCRGITVTLFGTTLASAAVLYVCYRAGLGTGATSLDGQVGAEAAFLALATSLAVTRGVYVRSGGAPSLPPSALHPHAARAWPLFLAASVCLSTAVCIALALTFFWFAATLLSVGVSGSPGPFLFMIGVFWGVPVAALLLPTAGAAAAGTALAAARMRQLAVFGTEAQQPGLALQCYGFVDRFLAAAATSEAVNLACGGAGTAVIGAIALFVSLLGKDAARFLGAPSMYGSAVVFAAAGIVFAAVAWRSSGGGGGAPADPDARALAQESDSAVLVVRPAEVLSGPVMSP